MSANAAALMPGDAAQAEREALAVEVAEAFVATFGNVEVAQTILDNIKQLRVEASQQRLWREVETALAQIRG